MIKGLDRPLETFHRLGDCPPRALFRFPSAQSEVRPKAAFAASVCLQKHGPRDVHPVSRIWDGDL